MLTATVQAIPVDHCPHLKDYYELTAEEMCDEENAPTGALVYMAPEMRNNKNLALCRECFIDVWSHAAKLISATD